ncbi:MAG: TonB-dependent receptor [Flavobacteriales bacterium]|nr:TonB-dependent receptor [Flavobacteriales bacterium]
MTGLLPVVGFAQPRAGGVSTVTGRVLSGGKPVAYASVALKGTTRGAASDADGRFRLDNVAAGPHTLVLSAIGFARAERPITVKEGEDLVLGDIAMERSTADLDELVVTGTMREVSRSESPVSIEVITPALFRKNPSPVLFDAVGMVNGVRSQLNCSVCNTGDIHINGMEGPYTMILIDGMPIVSALSTVYGLSGIPISMIERVEVMKGPGGALYGSEAMGGIINVITKDPVLAPQASAEVIGTTWGELNADIGVRLGRKKVSDLLGVNVFNYSSPRDGNNDGFTDVTLQQRVSVFNKLALRRPDRRVASVAARYVNEGRWGGQMNWTPAFAGSDSIYGETIRTNRWEAIGQYQLPVPGTLMLQVSANGHRQRSWYGATPYNAEQQVYFGQLYWSRKLGQRHDLLTGLAYRHTRYHDNTPATNVLDDAGEHVRDRPEQRPLPGLFVQDEWSMNEFHKLLLGYRLDNDKDHGLVHSPRVAYKWAPSGRWAVRANFGTGFRVVNLFTEDHAALTGARKVVIAHELRPERSLNGSLNVVRKWPREKHFFGLDGTLFYTHFSNQIVPDYSTDADLIIYDNLDGRAVSRGASLNAEARIGQPLKLHAGATWMDVFKEVRGMREDLYFAPRWSGTFTASYTFSQPWTVDLTGQVYGPMRLPVLPDDFRPEYSPTYALLNLQVKRTINDRWEIYGGAKNLLNFIPKNPLMRPFDPFDRLADDPVSNPNGYTFDTVYIYAPVQGVRGFLGVRWVVG